MQIDKTNRNYELYTVIKVKVEYATYEARAELNNN